jgi:hypothetical protein
MGPDKRTRRRRKKEGKPEEEGERGRKEVR